MSQKAKYAVVVLMVAILVAPAAATAQQPARLTLAAAVDLALRNHPAIREARAGSAAASSEVAVARTAYLPRLDLLWQTNRATRNNVFGLLLPQSIVPPVSGPVLGTDTLDGVWSSAGGLLFSWEAVDFGRRRAGVELARAQSDAADAERRVTELDVASGAADAFLALLAAESAQTAARANVERLSVFADSVRVLVDNQLRPGAERSRADAELAAARTRQAEADRNVELARILLAEAVGAPDTRFEIDGRALEQAPAASAQPALETAGHPSVVAADAEVTAVRAQDRVLSAANLPRIDLQTAVSGRGVNQAIDGRSNGNGLSLDVPNWAIGVSVTLPSLEVFRTQARRRVEAGRLLQASAHYDRTVQALQAQDARARAVLSAAQQIAANTPQQLQAARDTNTQARARYDAGLATVVEVAEAQRLLAAAESENAVATLTVWRALLGEAVLSGDVQSFVSRIPAAPAASLP